ncbi:MAG TPA: hypothetical protein VJM32_00605 [Candidatus Saccharimonadales bacterium]|nr:hypothetical protein [Candidatus Saccharimonadales bacterium]
MSKTKAERQISSKVRQLLGRRSTKSLAWQPVRTSPGFGHEPITWAEFTPDLHNMYAITQVDHNGRTLWVVGRMLTDTSSFSFAALLLALVPNPFMPIAWIYLLGWSLTHRPKPEIGFWSVDPRTVVESGKDFYSDNTLGYYAWDVRELAAS